MDDAYRLAWPCTRAHSTQRRTYIVKLNRITTLGAAGVLAAIALAGCSATPSSTSTDSPSAAPSSSAITSKVDASLTGTITSGGSSAQANAQAAWTAAYNAQVKGVTINYDKSQGSGGGVTN